LKKKILYVDDERDLAELTKLNIEETKLYEVDIAFSGKEAIEKVKSQAYNLIFVDFIMPELNGVQTCKAIRDLDSNVPLVIISAKLNSLDNTDWECECYCGEDNKAYIIKRENIREIIGNVSYMHKPFSQTEILESIAKALERT